MAKSAKRKRLADDDANTPSEISAAATKTKRSLPLCHNETYTNYYAIHCVGGDFPRDVKRSLNAYKFHLNLAQLNILKEVPPMPACIPLTVFDGGDEEDEVTIFTHDKATHTLSQRGGGLCKYDLDEELNCTQVDERLQEPGGERLQEPGGYFLNFVRKQGTDIFYQLKVLLPKPPGLDKN